MRPTTDEVDRARLTTAHHAHDPADLSYLLTVLGLLNPGPGTAPRDVPINPAGPGGKAVPAKPGRVAAPREDRRRKATPELMAAILADPRPTRPVAADLGVSHSLVQRVRAAAKHAPAATPAEEGQP